MGEITLEILQELWNTTQESTWDSLITNIDELHERDIITTDQWENLEFALSELKNRNHEFPDSVGELAVFLKFYL